MAKVKYVGTWDDDTDEVTHRGITLPKGKAVEVDDAMAGHFEGNPTFEVTPTPKTAAKA